MLISALVTPYIPEYINDDLLALIRVLHDEALMILDQALVVLFQMDSFLVTLALDCAESCLDEANQIEKLIIELEIERLQLRKVHQVIDQRQQHTCLILRVICQLLYSRNVLLHHIVRRTYLLAQLIDLLFKVKILKRQSRDLFLHLDYCIVINFV